MIVLNITYEAVIVLLIGVLLLIVGIIMWKGYLNNKRNNKRVLPAVRVNRKR